MFLLNKYIFSHTPWPNNYHYSMLHRSNSHSSQRGL